MRVCSWNNKAAWEAKSGQSSSIANRKGILYHYKKRHDSYHKTKGLNYWKLEEWTWNQTKAYYTVVKHCLVANYDSNACVRGEILIRIKKSR